MVEVIYKHQYLWDDPLLCYTSMTMRWPLTLSHINDYETTPYFVTHQWLWDDPLLSHINDYETTPYFASSSLTRSTVFSSWSCSSSSLCLVSSSAALSLSFRHPTSDTNWWFCFCTGHMIVWSNYLICGYNITTHINLCSLLSQTAGMIRQSSHHLCYLTRLPEW